MEYSAAHEHASDAMDFTMDEPRQDVDPLIAAQIHNYQNSPLYRLPTEVLSAIIEECDPVSILALKWTSRRLREITLDLKPRLDELSWLELIHLTRSEMCTRCLEKRNGWGLLKLPWYGCPLRRKGMCTTEDSEVIVLLCGHCHVAHPCTAFSSVQRKTEPQSRICLGRQGGVRLCDHVKIPWSKIENHFLPLSKNKNGKRSGPRRKIDWEDRINSFHVSCDHPSHDARCSHDQEPTRPQARLRRADNGFSVVLEMTWAPHSGPGVFRLSHDGRVNGPDLRALFEKYSAGPARYLVPSPLPLREMQCFDPSKCGCIDFDTQPQQASQLGENSAIHQDNHMQLVGGQLFSPSCPSEAHSCASHKTSLCPYTISMEMHGPQPPADFAYPGHRCLVTTYTRTIDIGVDTSLSSQRINPSHEWYHAMDAHSYNPALKHICQDKQCVNYYQRLLNVKCKDPVCPLDVTNAGIWEKGYLRMSQRALGLLLNAK